MRILTRSLASLPAIGIAVLSLGSVDSRAAETIFGQTFYSSNTALSQSDGSLIWNTATDVNSEMHTNFGPISLAIGEKFEVTFGLRFFEPDGNGGNATTDGIRIGLLDLTTQTFADGTHTATTGDGYRFRFNWERAVDVQGGEAVDRKFAGSNANYLTSTGGLWDSTASSINGFGLNADGSMSYPVVFSVERTSETDALVMLSINGVERTFLDTGDGHFTYDTLALAKIGDNAGFNKTATVTITDFSATVVPEPSAALFAVAGVGALAMRRRRMVA